MAFISILGGKEHKLLQLEFEISGMIFRKSRILLENEQKYFIHKYKSLL